MGGNSLEPTGDPVDPPNLKAAKLNIEHNATDEDTGFQGFIDSEGWQQLDVMNPDDEVVLSFEGHNDLGDLGLTELFFETVETANDDVSIAEMLALLPAGDYTIAGTSMQNGESGGPTSGTAVLTHTIPAGPQLLGPQEGATVSTEDLMMSWNPVTDNDRRRGGQHHRLPVDPREGSAAAPEHDRQDRYELLRAGHGDERHGTGRDSRAGHRV